MDISLNGDVAFVLLELISKSEGLSLKEILDNSPFEKKEILHVTSSLISIEILIKELNENNEFIYYINKNITAYHITKAVEIGVDMSDISTLLPITDKQKKAALILSTQNEKLKKMDEDLKSKKSLKENKININNLPRDMIVETLERLTLASEISIEDFSHSHSDSVEILKALKEARDQALKSLKDYQKSLLNGSTTGGY